MKKQYIVLTVLIIFIFTLASPGFASPDDQKTIMINREITASVEQIGQKQELIVPGEPLEFDSMLNWEVSINKKSLTNEKAPAYFAIQDMGPGTKEIARKIISGSGSVVIPKRTRYKIILAAGEYTRLLGKSGAEINAKLNYTEVMVRYSQGDKPFQFGFEILGPAEVQEWSWLWSVNNTSSGNKVTHQFDSDGKIPVMVKGTDKTLPAGSSHNYYFEFEVPSLIVLNPKVDPLQGPQELLLAAHTNANINYGQKATYNWDFGDGASSSGPDTDHIYNKPGCYQLILTVKVNDSIIEKSWLVNVNPLQVTTGATVTPASASVPMEITGNVNPKVTGGPTQLSYHWDIAGQTAESSSFKHKFSEPGTYRILLKTVDKLHPDLVIPEEVFVINALPPQITLKPSVSLAKGYIPFTANFNPNVKVQGAPVDLVYRWDFGDGEVSDLEKPNHIFKKPGVYQVRLTVSDRLHKGNLAEDMIKMDILPPEIKVTALADISSGLLPLTVNLYAQVSVTGSPCEPLYFWNFGDSETSIDQNPVHIFTKPGKYTVKLEVKDRLHLGNTVKTSLQIDAKVPKLTFTAKVLPLSGSAPLTINGVSKGLEEGVSNPNLKYVWDFGDGTTAVGAEQTHIYAKRGTYSVLVYVEDSSLKITERKVFKVTVK